MLSRAYQLSSQLDEKNFEADPDNVLVWRMPKRRLEAEALRDTMLALAGQLDLTPPKGSSGARGGEGNASFRVRGRPGRRRRSRPTRTARSTCRSSATGCRRSLTLFDFPDPSLIIGERATTTVPAQSLYLMNNPFVIRQAEALADKLLAGERRRRGRADAGLPALLFARRRRRRSCKSAQKFLADYGRKQPRRATWAALCQALFASAEFSASVDEPSGARRLLPLRIASKSEILPPLTDPADKRDSMSPTEINHEPMRLLPPRRAEERRRRLRLPRLRRPLDLGRREGATRSAPKTPHFPARAKRVIFLCMEGAPVARRHLRLQAEAAADSTARPCRGRRGFGGKLLASPWKFAQHGQSGLWISELFPELAKHADDLCLLHGMHTDVPAHPQAFLQMHTGMFQFKRPSMGAWTFYGLGTENENLPGFVTISPPLQNGGPANYGSAFLPAVYQGTPIRMGFGGFGGGGRAAAAAAGGSVSNIRNPRQSTDAQRTQLDFIQSLNRETLERDPHNPGIEGAIESFELAFRMQKDLPKLMDLANETAATQALYGIGEQATEGFGRQCLLARRFVEAGVRFVEVTSRRLGPPPRT